MKSWARRVLGLFEPPSLPIVLGVGLLSSAGLALASEPSPPADASPDETLDREAALFGEEPSESAREEAIFGNDPGRLESSDESDLVRESGDLASRLAEIDRKTELGAFLFMRFDLNSVEKTELRDQALSSPSLMDFFLDSRPNDRVRGYVRGRLRHDATAQGGEIGTLGQALQRTEALLDQLWLKFDVSRRLFLTVGKQPIRWGSSRIWNPTDFMNRQSRDPLAVFDERTGVTLLKVHLPIEGLGWNFYALANLEDADRAGDLGAGLRGEFLVGHTEIALSYGKRRAAPTQLGLDLTSGIGLFDLRAELGAQKGLRTPFFRDDFDVNTLMLPGEIDRRGEWILQMVFGAEVALRYSDEDNLILGMEYFFNDAGYDSAALYPVLLADPILNPERETTVFRPLFLGRHYASLYAVLMAPGTWNDSSFTVNLLGNLSDGSYLARLDYNVRLLTYLDFNVFGSYHFGNRGGEFRFAIVDNDVQTFLRSAGLPPIRAPVAEIGLGLRLYF